MGFWFLGGGGLKFIRVPKGDSVTKMSGILCRMMQNYFDSEAGSVIQFVSARWLFRRLKQPLHQIGLFSRIGMEGGFPWVWGRGNKSVLWSRAIYGEVLFWHGSFLPAADVIAPFLSPFAVLWHLRTHICDSEGRGHSLQLPGQIQTPRRPSTRSGTRLSRGHMRSSSPFFLPPLPVELRNESRQPAVQRGGWRLRHLSGWFQGPHRSSLSGEEVKGHAGISLLGEFTAPCWWEIIRLRDFPLLSKTLKHKQPLFYFFIFRKAEKCLYIWLLLF